MTTDEKREAIRLKVCKALPEILELKKGCLIRPKKFTQYATDYLSNILGGEYFQRENVQAYNYLIEIVNYVHRLPYSPLIFSGLLVGITGVEDKLYVPPYQENIQENFEFSNYNDFEGSFQIIGRPINALDILQALGNDFLLSGDGTVYQYNSEIYERTDFVLPTSQTLDQWDESTIDKLYDLFYPCSSHHNCSHNTNGRDMNKPCSIELINTK